jgi:prepilin peptidase CpaA
MTILARLLPFVPLLAMLTWAAIEDLRTRRIRNWLTFSLVLSGIAQSLMGSGTVTIGSSLAGCAVGFGLPLVLFALGAIGGGDVKLLAGVGAWVGAGAVFEVFCAAAVVGMVIVLAQACAQGRLRVLSRNSAVLAMNLVHIGDVGVAHTTATGKSSRSVEKPLPYAVPVLIAVVALLVLRSS